MPRFSDSTCGGVRNEYRSQTFNSFLFFTFTLFDFYKYGFRIFELTAYALLLLAIVLRPPRFRVSHIYYFPLIILGLIYFVMGLLFSEYPKSTIGLFIGVLAFVLFSIRNKYIPQGHLRIILMIHLFFFFMQFTSYYLFDQVIEYQQFTDIDPMLESYFFRPAGLFYEPAIYCLAVYMLLMLLDPQGSRFNILEIVASMSMMLSFSMWGIVSALLILFRLAFLKRIFLFPLIVSIYLIVTIALTVENPFVPWLYMRLGDLGSDASAIGRYGAMASFFQTDSVFRMILGSGFGASFEQYGSNGISYLLSAIGIAGFIGFFILILFSSPNRGRVFIFFVPVLLAAPIFAYGFFPMWLSQITNRYRTRPIAYQKTRTYDDRLYLIHSRRVTD